MIVRGETKAFVRSQGLNLKRRVGKLYAATLESKIARTFTDDANLHHGALSVPCSHMRPGQRDDENICFLAAPQTVY